MKVSALQAAKRAYSNSTVSVSTFVNDIGLKVGRELSGEEIAAVLDKYGPDIQKNYFSTEGPSNCSYDMF